MANDRCRAGSLRLDVESSGSANVAKWPTDIGFLTAGKLASWQAAATLREPAMKPDTTLASLNMRELDMLKVIQASTKVANSSAYRSPMVFGSEDDASRSLNQAEPEIDVAT